MDRLGYFAVGIAAFYVSVFLVLLVVALWGAEE